MDKYEISLWEDFPDTANSTPFLNERKICVIGSNTMTSAARALEPKLVSNVNGTNTFSFRIYYRYKDEITGEENINPYLSYIINERKVKVLWKDEWYDLVIKKIEEDTQKRSILCTCEDLFISELSKNGYELEFSSELQNNSGTASELMEKVLEGSGWRPAAEQQKIIQYQEEPVYEVVTQIRFNAIKQSPNPNESGSMSIPLNAKCLLFQSCLNEDCVNIQFLYSNDEYITESHDMLVLNGDCYTFIGKVISSGNQVIVIDNSGRTIFEFNISESYSSNYRAKRLVNSQVTVFDKLLGRYVDVYTYEGNEVYGYETTEYSDPTLVVNLIANSKDFKDTKGWIGGGDGLTWKVSPSFTVDSNGIAYYSTSEYEAKSYLQVPSGDIYNTAFVSNKTYLNPSSTDIKNGLLGGFQIGDKYIFRYKAKGYLRDDTQSVPYLTSGIIGNVYDFTIGSTGNYTPTGSAYFLVGSKVVDNDWVEYTLECNRACPANQLDQVGFFINVSSLCYIEEIQFFKLAYGIAKYKDKESDPEPTKSRINPGEISLQSIVNVVYRYYNPNHKINRNEIDDIEDPKDIKFLYQGTTKSDSYIPKYNNYEKITSIEESKSNRFNILQSIAEKFECWVRFIINHDENGRIRYDDQGLPQKYVQLVEQIGHDTGISFEYGIDLKGIKRTIISNAIATKAIIIPNENEFGSHGFCTIARSPLNYCRENFILNFDYYIQQGLLNQDVIEADLYKTNNGHLGYYFYLNQWNKRYDTLADLINNKQIELTKQRAEYKVQVSNLRAAEEKLTDSISDLILLAGVDNLTDAQRYAETHVNNRKVQSLMGTIGKLRVNIRNLSNSVTKLEGSISTLETYINSTNTEMNNLVESIESLHEQFFKKYSRFIQEGTWQDQNYVDDDKYYLDALEVAYRSSRPQIQYDISLLRLSGLEDFSSKVFDLGDICYIQDKEFFGYEEDKITPYKQRIIISQLTSYFDTPEKDIIKVQNYKTQFDDLFQRITTATQALQFSQGRFERAAGVVKPDKTLSFSLLQDTFDYNKDLVLNSANQQVTWDNTGITVADETNSALKVKIMAGGIFASNDGGHTWKNALRGDGISTDLLTAGRINTSEIYVYDGQHTSFRWDSQGINAYTINTLPELDENGEIKRVNGNIIFKDYPFSKYVRFDQYGLYGYSGREDFIPEDEDEIWAEPDVRFGLTWKGFFLRGESDQAYLEITNEKNWLGDDQVTFRMGNSDENSSIEISTDNDILLKTGNVDRVQIGRYKYQRVDEEGIPQYYPGTTEPIIDTDYGIFVRDSNGDDIFTVSTNGVDSIGGWNLTKDSFYHTVGNWGTVGLYSKGKVWTIEGPEEDNPLYEPSSQGSQEDEELLIEEIIDSEDIDVSDEPAKADGHRDIYYILAGNKFGVTLDGRVYSTGGRIGGWTIGERTLSAVDRNNRSIVIDSSGSISVANRTDQAGNVTSGWEINSNGDAIFHNIIADNGTIAGWMFTPTGLYNTLSHTMISSDSYDNINRFTIDTDSLRAQGGLIGGWTLNPASISTNGVYLNSNGILNLGPNGQLIAGNVIIRENEILFKPNADADPIDIGTSYQTFYENNEKLENLYVEMGVEFDPGSNAVTMFAIGDRVDTAESDAAEAIASVSAYIDVVDGHTQSIVDITSDVTNINSKITNIEGRLIADSISSDIVNIAKHLNVSNTIDASQYRIAYNENYVDIGNHTHYLAEGTGVNAGKIFIQNVDWSGQYHSFDIADTAYFKAEVSAREAAVNINTITDISNPGSWNKEGISSDVAYSTTTKMLYGYFNIKLSNNNIYSARIGLDAIQAYEAGERSAASGQSVTINSITNISNPGSWDFTPSATNSDNIVYGTTGKTIQSYFNITLSNNNTYSTRVTIDATKAYNAGRNSYTSTTKTITSNGTYTPESNERWSSVKVNVTSGSGIFGYQKLATGNKGYTNIAFGSSEYWDSGSYRYGNVKITCDSHEQYYQIRMPKPTSSGGSWGITIYNPDSFIADDDLYLTFDSDHIGYSTYNGILYGYIQITHGSASQNFIVNVDTSHVPTSGGGSSDIDWSLITLDRSYNDYDYTVQGPYTFQGDKCIDVRIFYDGTLKTTKRVQVNDWPDSSGGSHAPDFEYYATGYKAWISSTVAFVEYEIRAVCGGEASAWQVAYKREVYDE